MKTAISVIAAFLLLTTGCRSFQMLFSSVSIRTESNLSSVKPGGILRFTASGRDIIWSVSSTRDGIGQPANGTYISQDGVLYVDVNERELFLFIFAMSAETGQSDSVQIRVSMVSSVHINRDTDFIVLGRSLQFRAVVSGSNNPDNFVRWRVSTNAEGTGAVTPGTSINSNGMLTVASNETARTLYVIATSLVDPLVSGNSSVNVVVPVITEIRVDPVNTSVRAGTNSQFRAEITGTYSPDRAVTWRVSSNAAGTGAVTPGTTINNNGLLNVAANESLPILYVIATSVYDPSKSAFAIITIVRPTITSVSVSPGNQALPRGGSMQFQSNISGTNNPDISVTWRVSSNAAGTGAVTPGTTIDSNGLLRVSPNEASNILYVFAISVFDPSRSGSVIVNITGAIQPPLPPIDPPTEEPPIQPPEPPVIQPPPVHNGVTIIPSSHTASRGDIFQFTAMVQGYTNPNPPLNWHVSSTQDGTGAVSSGTRITGNGQLTIGASETNAVLYVFAFFAPNPGLSGMAIVMVRTN